MNQISSSGNLCFKEDEFLDKNFSVDKFVTKCKDHVSMSTLREDLETHYKSIQLALIELINRDYADFVSLSSNLIDFNGTCSEVLADTREHKIIYICTDFILRIFSHAYLRAQTADQRQKDVILIFLLGMVTLTIASDPLIVNVAIFPQ